MHNSSNLFTGSYFGIGLSSTNLTATSWNQIKYCPDVISLINDNGTFYAGVAYDGVLRSNDNGNTWNKISNNIPNGTVYAVAASGSKIFAGTPGYGVYYSNDNGTTWNAVNNGLSNNFIQALAINGNNIYAGSNTAGIFISTNNGTDWTHTTLNDKNIITIKVHDNKIYAGTWGAGIYVSSNNGTSWTQINNGLDAFLVYSICFDNNNIYASIQENVFFSTNSGQNWFKANSGLPQINIWSIDIVGSYVFVGTGGMGVWKRPLSEFIIAAPTAPVATNATLITQTGFTANWNASPDANGYYLDISTNSNFSSFITGYNNRDVGTNTSFVISGLLPNTNHYYRVRAHNAAGTSPNSNVISVTLVGVEDEEMPTEFNLEQNFPNPFNPSTNIQYKIPVASHVTLKVFDILGNEVATLVDEYQQPGGYNSKFSIKNSQLSSGVYFYKIFSGDYTSTKKFILIK
jgi:photosystem II stability/assembly factor-like uncharacterized protein